MGESLAESQGDAKWAGECEVGVEAERSGLAQLEVSGGSHCHLQVPPEWLYRR